MPYIRHLAVYALKPGWRFSLIRRLRNVRSLKVSMPRDLWLGVSNRSEIRQASRQKCCRGASQILEQCEHVKPNLAASRAIRCLIEYWNRPWTGYFHYSDVTMSATASEITSLTIVYASVYSGADQRKYQSSASLAFDRGIQRWRVNSPHKGSVTRIMFPLDDVIMFGQCDSLKDTGLPHVTYIRKKWLHHEVTEGNNLFLNIKRIFINLFWQVLHMFLWKHGRVKTKPKL